MSEKFVISWVTSKHGGEMNPWVMVLHEERGWEFPGGATDEGEEWDVAALRELYEETGLLGTAKAYDENLVNGGVVVWIEVEEEPGPEPWLSTDPMIAEVGWCVEAPNSLAWSVSEIDAIRNHDWSASVTLSS
ncbi:MAG: NUDIX domain-containing protein [Candidatus Thermoplasmatota archaeon]|nr:NUDIX domain-containing protein [Candidatus Thermoplasmatota archaeon]MED5274121.1 NUDIX domain-containing protein [Candidatus Thermoplasmatota archaeon]